MEYEIGRPYWATVDSKPDSLVIYADPDSKFPWFTTASDARFWCETDDVTDVRPLIMLDLDGLYDGVDMGGWEYVVDILRRDIHASNTRNKIADQIEAQMKARIEEPKGLGAVVETDGGVRYVRDPAGCWRSEDECRFWSDLNVLRVLSPGIND